MTPAELKIISIPKVQEEIRKGGWQPDDKGATRDGYTFTVVSVRRELFGGGLCCRLQR